MMDGGREGERDGCMERGMDGWMDGWREARWMGGRESAAKLKLEQ